ncbi:MAG: hypothetical protein NT096_10890 [Proteobacteria bacterium]|nr:hypothetical protein [Pseudomonadota bacterium]
MYSLNRDLVSLILILGFVGFASLAMAQESKEFIIKDIRPTLTGYQNKAFVETKYVGQEKLKMVAFWIKNEPNKRLVAAKGGAMWGSPDFDYFVGNQGEKILSGPGSIYVAIDGDSQFIGNLDFDGSVYTFIGKVRLAGYNFDSDTKSPLSFKLVKEKGFVYLSGKGIITAKDGKLFQLGFKK